LAGDGLVVEGFAGVGLFAGCDAGGVVAGFDWIAEESTENASAHAAARKGEIDAVFMA
jgi:hypothetical protein